MIAEIPIREAVPAAPIAEKTLQLRHQIEHLLSQEVAGIGGMLSSLFSLYF
jgi:hypothetical protein